MELQVNFLETQSLCSSQIGGFFELFVEFFWGFGFPFEMFYRRKGKGRKENSLWRGIVELLRKIEKGKGKTEKEAGVEKGGRRINESEERMYLATADK